MNYLTKLMGRLGLKKGADEGLPAASEPPATVHLLESVQAPASPEVGDRSDTASSMQAYASQNGRPKL